MDIERRRADADLGDKRKPRLIEESELPDFLTQDADEMEREEEEETEREKIRQEEMGRGNRSRKDVAYQEQLSEKDWLKAIGAEEEGGSSDDDRYSNMDAETPSKKKKKNKKRDFDEEEPQKKKKKGNKKLGKKMKKLIEVVMQYEDSDGRVLSEPFWKLPSRKELPDYYEIIKKPVDIEKIQRRIEEDKYEDMSALQKDFMQLCVNTQQYNEDGSLIFEDSIVLQSVFTNARERLEQEPDEPDEPEEPEMMDQDEESRMSMGSTSSKKAKKKDKDGSKSAKKKKKRPVDSEEEDDE